MLNPRQDLSSWVSAKTGRGPLVDGWRNSSKPIMCSYKKVHCSFEVYGFQTRTEEFIHKVGNREQQRPSLRVLLPHSFSSSGEMRAESSDGSSYGDVRLERCSWTAAAITLQYPIMRFAEALTPIIAYVSKSHHTFAYYLLKTPVVKK